MNAVLHRRSAMALAAVAAAGGACLRVGIDGPPGAGDAGRSDGGLDAGARDAGAPPYDDLAAVCEDAPVALCDYFVRCEAASTPEGCLDFLINRAHAFDPCLIDEAAAIHDGRMRFYGDRARRCVDAVQRTIGCTSWGPYVTVDDCFNSFEGTVPVGGACYLDAECVVAAFCAASGLGPCPGACQPRRPLGYPAVRDRECQPGLYAYGGSCRAPAVPSASCAPVGAAGGLQRCADGHYCDANYRCVPLRTLGQSCRGTEECVPLLECSNGVCRSAADVGEGCQFPVGGNPSIPCKLDLACDVPRIDAPGVCRPSFGAGLRCFGTLQCAGNLYCAGAIVAQPPNPSTPGVCAAQRAANAACRETEECQFGLYCDLDARVCKPRKDAGEACTAAPSGECAPDPSTGGSLECAAGLCCVGGQCRSLACHDPTP